MRLITGPPGSGKTTLVLEAFRQALRGRNDAVRLLVPTATLARHLQNRIAREGFVFRPGLVQTLSAFVAGWAEDLPQVSDAALYLIVEQAARRVRRPEFAQVEQMPGFCASVARAIGEFASAGCDSARLAAGLPDAPFAAAFLAVYREVERELEQRGLALRGKRFERAAERIARDGLNGIRTIWLDGFHELPDPELRVIESLGRHADVSLTFEAMDARLQAIGFREERPARSRPSPVVALVAAPGIEREVEEIARRILEQAAAGRPFREMAVIVRAKDIYVPVLRSTLERFGIPARFYFDQRLDQHAVVRFLTGAVDAMLSGWDHAQTLAVLRLAPRFADSETMDRLDFAVRDLMPDSGLGAMKGLAEAVGADRVAPLVDALAAIEEWRALTLAPEDWTARMRTLRALFRPAVAGKGLLSIPLHSQAPALQQFDRALDEAAEALPASRQIGIEEFWRAVKSVLRLIPLRVDDERRNVVHILSAPEARQWVLPVVFVCGLVEKQFPHFHPQDPFFPDDARRSLHPAGVRLRTAADFEREERALFDAAVSRATLLVTLSYPEFDARGDRNLPSLFLDGLAVDRQESRAVRPQPRHPPGPAGPVRIDAPALLDFLRQKTARVSATALESFLQCPFQFFGGRALRLKKAPLRPQERLDFLTQGLIVHRVLAEWWPAGGDIERLFETAFAQACEEKRIPRGYHTERLRNAMLDDLQVFAADGQWERGRFESRAELEFAFPLDSLEVTGKIDRLDVTAGRRAFVIDYKYSNSQRTKDKRDNGNLLQAPLYLMAAERCFGLEPAGMYYVGLKKEVVYVNWKDALPAGWSTDAERRTLYVVGQIRSGRVEPAPADIEKCRYCDCRDVCRVVIRQAAAEAEGA